MDNLYEQSKALEMDAKNISSMILSNEDVAHAIAILMYRYAILRTDLIELKEKKMPKFIYGKTSKLKLNCVCTDLCAVMYDALDAGIMDISIIEGHRDKVQQNRYFDIGKSKVQYPNGKHNKAPSEAIDVAPYINGNASWNKLHCCVLAGIILACAAKRGINIRWGGNWDMDAEPITDQDFQDLVHYEIVKE